MEHIESILVLMLAATLLVRAADYANVPAPIVLVLGGLAIAFVPGLPEVELDPDTIFLVFLPPLVFSAGWRTSPRELRTVLRPLGLLAVALVFVTAGVVAVVAHALVPELGWAEAAVLGAILAPTDAVAAIAVFRRLGGPERLRLLVEGESMINDATALVLFRIAVGVAAGGAFALGDAALEYVLISLGGIAVGLLVGALSIVVIRRQDDASLVVVLTVLTAYGAYIGAEELHVSGILAAVVAGLYGGYQAPRAIDADTRLGAVAFWNVLIFFLETILFVLLGVQLPGIVDSLGQTSSGIGELLLPIAAIAAASILVRLAFVFAMGDDAGETRGERFAVGWSGMRGAVSLAAALAVPLSVSGRPQIIFVTFALILITLVGQGLTLPFVIRKLHLEEPRRWSDEEAVARMEAAQAALDRIEEIEEEGRASESQLQRLRDLYRARFRMCQQVLGGEDPDVIAREQRLADYGALRRELIAVEREILLDLLSKERLRNATMRQIERDLDLEEARIRA
ncbi:MAG TPA: Na+/H+ antiporter [Solirubrobacterales bacterium]|nr:Na+/H+ antiporter [Solirubrobacterales bacterium]